MVGADKKAVLWLLAEAGDACDAYLDEVMRHLKDERIQCDEIWSFLSRQGAQSAQGHARGRWRRRYVDVQSTPIKADD
jgi:hypothetical protein